MVTGDEDTINQSQDATELMDSLAASKISLKENDNEYCSKIDYSENDTHHALSTADEEHKHDHQISTDREPMLNTTATESELSETTPPQPTGNLEVQAAATNQPNMAEKEMEDERRSKENIGEEEEREKYERGEKEEGNDERENEEKYDEREDEEEVETDEGAFAGDEASQSASATSILSPSENASTSSSIIPTAFFQNESTGDTSKTSEITKSDTDAVLDPVVSLIDLGDVDVVEKVEHSSSVNFPQAEEEEDNTPVLSNKFSAITSTHPKRDRSHNLHHSMRHVTLEGGKGELMAVQQKARNIAVGK